MGAPSSSPVRRLIHEIHRRSLWQVLSIYLVGAWAALQVVSLVAETAGLPPWAGSIALVILVLGLPFVLATAYVQEGRSDVVEGEVVAGGTEQRRLGWKHALVACLATAAVLTVAVSAWLRPTLGAPASESVGGGVLPSVAVMPCDDLSSGNDQAAIAQGVAEEVSVALSRLPELKVSGRASTLALKAQGAGLPAIGSALGVATVLTCGILRDGEQVRVTATLSDAATGAVLWSERYEEELTGLFAILDGVTRAIARELQIVIAGGTGTPLVSPGTFDPRAHEAYLRGRHFWNLRSGEGLARAIEEFTLSLELDPGYAEAAAGLADAHVYTLFFSELTDLEGVGDNLAKALSAARSAVASNPQLGMARASLGLALWSVGDWEGAEQELRAALELNPGYDPAHTWYELLLYTTGRPEEAIPYGERAVELNPVSPGAITDLGRAYWVSGRHDEAVALYRRALELAPMWSGGWGELAPALLALGQIDESREAWMESSRLAGVDPAVADDAFRAMVEHRRTAEPQSCPEVGSRIAFDYIACSQSGDVEAALVMARASVDQNAIGMFAVNHALYTSGALKRDPQYQALLARAGITW